MRGRGSSRNVAAAQSPKLRLGPPGSLKELEIENFSVGDQSHPQIGRGSLVASVQTLPILASRVLQGRRPTPTGAGMRGPLVWPQMPKGQPDLPGRDGCFGAATRQPMNHLTSQLLSPLQFPPPSPAPSTPLGRHATELQRLIIAVCLRAPSCRPSSAPASRSSLPKLSGTSRHISACLFSLTAASVSNCTCGLAGFLCNNAVDPCARHLPTTPRFSLVFRHGHDATH